MPSSMRYSNSSTSLAPASVASKSSGVRPLELTLGISKPSPAALALAEYLFAQGDHARDSHDTIRLVARQRFASGAPVCERPSRYDERIDLTVGQSDWRSVSIARDGRRRSTTATRSRSVRSRWTPRIS